MSSQGVNPQGASPMTESPTTNVATFADSTRHKPTAHHQQFITAGRWSTWFAKPLARLDLPDRLTLPTDRPVLFAGNHRSLFDVFATLAIFARFGASSRLLIRADYVQGGPTGMVLRNIGSIPASSETRQEAEDSAVAALDAGELVSIMPEGRLMRPEDWAESGVGPGRPGVSRIATRSGAAVIPVAFVGTERVWPRGGWPRLRARRPIVTMRLGAPLVMTGDDHQANTDALMAELGGLVKQRTPG